MDNSTIIPQFVVVENSERNDDSKLSTNRELDIAIYDVWIPVEAWSLSSQLRGILQ